ncbi:type III-B CRISPR module-associated protein Cmr3 [Aciditerrimonas ferrireducens]|uniref:type III-B CRISPR module-associated protein Cmr3 n=1 Tax=Aciditerrimonas ferrireducens TaxID=667306 RepID=UPI002004A681|nr:type III-B CRISPR module-associated protein Cmr3 [Aciditerrimonas ferrireducens]MCK4176163.1 type III-B CRISPR module-associated protein Cmr3 [Aciditerrimonas ferrireducens]
MALSWWMLEPVDVLAFRGNRGFGQSSELAETALLPRPSVLTGALRSALLVRLAEQDQRRFLRDEPITHPIGAAIGTARRFGTLRVAWASLGRRSGAGEAEPLVPLPLDLAVAVDDPGGGRAEVLRLREVGQEADTVLRRRWGSTLAEGLRPLVVPGARVKQPAGCWLTGTGWQAWLAGREVPRGALLTAAQMEALAGVEARVGIALDRRSRRAQESRLYVSQYVRFREGVGILVGLAGLPEPGEGQLDGTLVRLGGDGRAARLRSVRCPSLEAPTLPEEPASMSLVAVTPGVFRRGWLPDGVDRDPVEGGWVLAWGGLRARLRAAAVGAAEVVTGWSMSEGRPKAIAAAVPPGSVWRFELESGSREDLERLAGALRERSVGEVLTGRPGSRDGEGFSSCWLAGVG